MSDILLLGAGFSRNWGGWLASEVHDYLLGCPPIAADRELRRIVSDHKHSFEEALARVQSDYRNKNTPETRARLEVLQGALSQMFADLDQAYGAREFEFQNDLALMVRTFLIRFDAIFSLNQDTLLERHYFNDNILLGSSRRWQGWQLPGMQMVHDPSRAPLDRRPFQWSPAPTFEIRDRHQPCFKLHGSSNWISGEGSPLLVMGSGKSDAIQSHDVLRRSFDHLRDTLASPTRLMVIGYSFRDAHINQLMIDAARRGLLKLFIIDELGSGAIGQGNPSRGGAIYARSEVEDALEPVLIGGSRRRLGEIFSNERAEHAKVMRFFAS